MVQVAPSFLGVKDQSIDGLEAALSLLGDAPDLYHVDVMDGVYVPERTIYLDSNLVFSLAHMTDIPMDVHLMVAEPFAYIWNNLELLKYSKYISFHHETDDSGRVIDLIRKIGVQPAIAINPGQDINKIRPYFSSVDMVLVMSVVPGKGGQPYQDIATQMISEVRDSFDDLIEVDGGIKLHNAQIPVNVGAEILVSGSGIFGEPNPRHVIYEMQKL